MDWLKTIAPTIATVYIAGFLGVITVFVSLVLLMWLVTWERQWRWGS